MTEFTEKDLTEDVFNRLVAQRIVDRMNEFVHADTEATAELLSREAKCNAHLARHPTAQVRTYVYSDRIEHGIRLLGLLNGIAGATPEGQGLVVLEVDGLERPVRFLLNEGREDDD